MLSTTLVALATVAAAPAAVSPPAGGTPPPPLVAPPPTERGLIRPVPPRVPAVNQKIDVSITANQQLLWKGQLGMSSRGNASFNQNRQESFVCGDEPNNSRNRLSESLQFSIRANPMFRQDETHSVSVDWKRPLFRAGDDAICEQEAGHRSIGIQQSVRLQHGKTVKLQGDGGLVVTLTLR